MSTENNRKQIIEAALLAAGGAVRPERLLDLFSEEEKFERAELKAILAELAADYDGRAIELKEVGGGYRIQVRKEFATWISRLWEERPARYSRALMETLALIAYRQPITRGEIEEIRGVSVSTSIMRTLTDRDWVRVVGHRDVPGRPALYATTRTFLDYFGLRSLEELPTLAEIRDLDSVNRELEFDQYESGPDQVGGEEVGMEVNAAGMSPGAEPEDPGDTSDNDIDTDTDDSEAPRTH